MNRKNDQKIKHLLYCEDKRNIIAEIKQMSSLELHFFAANYNWDNGFEIPAAILDHEDCDFGTALLLFYHADGYSVLQSKDLDAEYSLHAWKTFMSNLFDRIVSGDFPKKSISFTPPLTKVQIFKLKKLNPSIPQVFLEKSPGDDVEVPFL